MSTHSYSVDAIIANNSPVLTFKHNGVHRNAQPVPIYYVFNKTGVTASNVEVFFDIPDTIIPKTIWVLYPSGSNPTGTVTLTIYNSANVIVWQLTLNIANTLEGNAFVYNFPLFVVQNGYIGSVKTSTANNGINVYAEIGYLEEIINSR